MTTTMTTLESAIAEFEDANYAFAESQQQADALEFGRPLEKDAAVRRIMGAMEGRGEKASYTGAEKTVEADPDYARYCTEVRKAKELAQKAWGRMTATKTYAAALAGRVAS
jgi:hypothetical protein